MLRSGCYTLRRTTRGDLLVRVGTQQITIPREEYPLFFYHSSVMMLTPDSNAIRHAVLAGASHYFDSISPAIPDLAEDTGLAYPPGSAVKFEEEKVEKTVDAQKNS